MCDKHTTNEATQRKGSRLADGHAHTDAHLWSRRSFLSTMGLASIGGTFMLAGRPVHALGNTPLTERLRQSATDRILVLVQLEGGNDGLNTVVPIRNDIYYASRPNLSIAPAETLALDDEHGLHPTMTAFRDIFADGHMAVVQNVGYDDSNLSHFRSTDILMSGSDENVVLETGWVGRYLDQEHPDFRDEQPDEPLAVQVGGSGLIFKAPGIDMGMSVRDLNRFDDFLDSGRFYTTDGLPATEYGNEMAFMRTTVNAAFRYGTAIQAAAGRGQSTAAYPNGSLGQGFSAIARLINGNLSTSIYVVTLGGFDTHALQADDHASLLSNLSNSVQAFLSDIDDPAKRSRIVLATFSEFGRRIEENGSEGTDHGTSAPMLIIGEQVNGGIYGTDADLSDPDQNGNMRHTTDYRQVYATLLEQWLGAAPEESAGVLSGSFDTLPLISGSSVSAETSDFGGGFGIASNYPNPFRERTVIRYAVDRPANVRIDVYDLNGRHVRRLRDGQQSAGEHEVAVDGTGLAAGRYVARMTSGARTSTATLVRVR